MQQQTSLKQQEPLWMNDNINLDELDEMDEDDQMQLDTVRSDMDYKLLETEMEQKYQKDSTSRREITDAEFSEWRMKPKEDRLTPPSMLQQLQAETAITIPPILKNKKFFNKLIRNIAMDGENVQYAKKHFGFTKQKFYTIIEEFGEHFHQDMITDKKILQAYARALKKEQEVDLTWNLYLEFVTKQYEQEILEQQDILDITDLTSPHQFYPFARQLKRKIIFHTGPTNSGKTYHAFQRLMQAKSGCYCAPLRLLAAEGYNKMKEKGLLVSLITGDHKIQSEEPPTHVACTVEMVNLKKEVDVAVIDEIQLIADSQRGWAWSRSFLGIPAKEIHICGEERTIKLIESICEDMKEDYEVSHYKRLSPLKLLQHSLNNDLRRIRKGDCVVTFSRRDVFRLKHQIEAQTKLKCAVVFGGLPADVRLEQAKLFNTQKMDVLIATDAIGYGLNLNIRRIIFQRVKKFDGVKEVILEPHLIRQIAGRAGRFASAYSEGEVTTLDSKDLYTIHAAFEPGAVEEIEKAGIKPSEDQLEFFVQEFDKNRQTSLSMMIKKFEELTTCSPNYFVCNSKEQREIADLIEKFDLVFKERITFTQAPVDVDDPFAMQILKRYVQNHAKGKTVPVLVQPSKTLPKTMQQLKEFESVCKILDAYIWLAYRFPDTFTEKKLAETMRKYCHKVIELSLRDTKLQQEKEDVEHQSTHRGKFMDLDDKRNAERKKRRKIALGFERDRIRKGLQQFGL